MTCLADLLANHIPLASESAQQKCYLTYTVPSPSLFCAELTLLETRSVLASSGTTGLRTWEAALYLGTFLSSASGLDLIKGKTILELGAGTGFLSILCARHLEARFVLATDGSAEVINDLESNIRLNELGNTNLIIPAILKWGHLFPDNPLNGDSRTYDLVLGADVVSALFCRSFIIDLSVTQRFRLFTEFKCSYKRKASCYSVIQIALL